MPTSKEMPLLVEWIEAMKKDSACAALVNENHTLEHTKGVLENKFDYDIGL